MQKMPDGLWMSADLAATHEISQTQLIDNRTSDYTPYDWKSPILFGSIVRSQLGRYLPSVIDREMHCQHGDLLSQKR